MPTGYRRPTLLRYNRARTTQFARTIRSASSSARLIAAHDERCERVGELRIVVACERLPWLRSSSASARTICAKHGGGVSRCEASCRVDRGEQHAHFVEHLGRDRLRPQVSHDSRASGGSRCCNHRRSARTTGECMRRPYRHHARATLRQRDHLIAFHVLNCFIAAPAALRRARLGAGTAGRELVPLERVTLARRAGVR